MISGVKYKNRMEWYGYGGNDGIKMMKAFKDAIKRFNLTNETKLKFINKPEWYSLDINSAYPENINLLRFYIKTKDECEHTSKVSLLYSFLDKESCNIHNVEINFVLPCDFNVSQLSDFMDILKIELQPFEFDIEEEKRKEAEEKKRIEEEKKREEEEKKRKKEIKKKIKELKKELEGGVKWLGT